MVNKYYRGFEKLFKFGKSAGENTGRSINTIIGVAPSKNITKFQKQKENIINTTDAYKSKVKDPEVKKSMNEGTSKTLSNISKIYRGEPITKKVKKADGGRIGRKLGGGADMAKRKTNIQKIKETFGPKKNVPNQFKGFSKLPEKVQKKIDAKLAKKV